MKTMKTILIVVVILLALVGVLSILLYVLNYTVSIQFKETSLLPIPRGIMISLPLESIKAEGVAKFTPLTQIESDSLVLIEDQSLLGLTGGAFNPQFEPLSSSEQKTLKTSEEQKPELQNMTAAGDPDENARIGWGAAVLILIYLFLGIPF